MTLNGWIQISSLPARPALVKPLGGYMTRVFTGERTFSRRCFVPSSAALYALAGIDEHQEQHWLAYAVAMLLFHVGGLSHPLRLLRLQAMLPFNPAEHGGGRAGPRLQHRGELRHQHQLAELRRREHDVATSRRCSG